MNPSPPPYSPNVVNQTVSYNGVTWKGNPGQGWVTEASTMSVEDLARRQRGLAMEAIKPAVTSLESSIPEIGNRFDTARGQAEAGRDPLLQRYENLISDLRASESGRVAETQGITAREMGRRGIPLSSTYAAEEGVRRTDPIRSETNALVRDTGLDRENKIRQLDEMIANLSLEQVAAERDVRNTIAGLQASAGTGAVEQAIQLYQIEQQKIENALNRALQEKELSIAELTASKPSTQIVTVGGIQKLIDSTTGQTISELGPTGSGGSGGGITINTPTIPLSTTTTKTPLTLNTKAAEPFYSGAPSQVQSFLKQQESSNAASSAAKNVKFNINYSGGGIGY